MRLSACSSGDLIVEDDLWETLPPPRHDSPPSAPRSTLKDAVEDLERRMIEQALTETRNNQLQAAKTLGLSRQGLINKMKRYALG
jgi:transcriptional regulator with PAS, ATPase and Fis domain